MPAHLKPWTWLIISSTFGHYHYHTRDTRHNDLDMTRNSSGDEIANVNFLYDDIVHALENTIDSCINSAIDRFLQRRFTKFSEITQCNGRSRSFKVTHFDTNPKLIYDFLLVINTNLPPILHLFQVMADYAKFSLARAVSHFIALARGDPCQYRHK